MTEYDEPQYVRPAQPPCPDCGCCSAHLCQRGQATVLGCAGLTSAEHQDTVRGCPCSAETTKGTAAWRAGTIRATRHAIEQPLPAEVEVLLRAVAAGWSVTDPLGLLLQLVSRRYVEVVDSRPAVTELGRAYLAGRDDPRHPTVVEVVSVDTASRTAQAIVMGWSAAQPVTVALDQLTSATGLTAAQLPGRCLEATANCRTPSADDLVLTGVRISPTLTQAAPPGGAG